MSCGSVDHLAIPYTLYQLYWLSPFTPPVPPRVIERSEENKMQAQNVAIVFGPTLMRTDDPLLIATLAPVQNNIVQNLLTDFNKIF